MKNRTLLILVLFLLSISACKKDDNVTPTNNNNNNNNNNNPDHPYYFKFTMNGTSNNFNGNIPQYMPFYENEIGGYQVSNTNLFPNVGLRLSWPMGDTVRESDVMGLIGRTLYFTDTDIHPELSYTPDGSADMWFSADTANTNYFVKITDVTFLKNDTAFNPLKTYVITGTCTGVMSDGTNTSVLSGGEFHYIISRRDL